MINSSAQKAIFITLLLSYASSHAAMPSQLDVEINAAMDSPELGTMVRFYAPAKSTMIRDFLFRALLHDLWSLNEDSENAWTIPEIATTQAETALKLFLPINEAVQADNPFAVLLALENNKYLTIAERRDLIASTENSTIKRLLTDYVAKKAAK